jgi:hypothetical protein
MDRDSIVARYRHLREISAALNSAVLAHVPRRAIFDYARFLGFLVGNTIVADSEDEFAMIFDLAIHSPRHTRSRAFERYRHSTKLPVDSDEGRVLDALCAARFAVARIERRHDVAGLVALDLLRDAELWLMDLNMEASAPDGFVIAAHLITIEGFSMTTGMPVPVNRDDLDDALDGLPKARAATHKLLADDPLFAGLVWRAARARGATENIALA